MSISNLNFNLNSEPEDMEIDYTTQRFEEPDEEYMKRRIKNRINLFCTDEDEELVRIKEVVEGNSLVACVDFLGCTFDVVFDWLIFNHPLGDVSPSEYVDICNYEREFQNRTISEYIRSYYDTESLKEFNEDIYDGVSTYFCSEWMSSFYTAVEEEEDHRREEAYYMELAREVPSSGSSASNDNY